MSKHAARWLKAKMDALDRKGHCACREVHAQEVCIKGIMASAAQQGIPP